MTGIGKLCLASFKFLTGVCCPGSKPGRSLRWAPPGSSTRGGQEGPIPDESSSDLGRHTQPQAHQLQICIMTQRLRGSQNLFPVEAAKFWELVVAKWHKPGGGTGAVLSLGTSTGSWPLVGYLTGQWTFPQSNISPVPLSLRAGCPRLWFDVKLKDGNTSSVSGWWQSHGQPHSWGQSCHPSCGLATSSQYEWSHTPRKHLTQEPKR